MELWRAEGTCAPLAGTYSLSSLVEKPCCWEHYVYVAHVVRLKCLKVSSQEVVLVLYRSRSVILQSPRILLHQAYSCRWWEGLLGTPHILHCGGRGGQREGGKEEGGRKGGRRDERWKGGGGREDSAYLREIVSRHLFLMGSGSQTWISPSRLADTTRPFSTHRHSMS